MLIACSSCATSYDVDPANLGPKGRPVRCVRCRAVWHAAPSRADKLLAAADAIGPGRVLTLAQTARPAKKAAAQPVAQPAAEIAGETRALNVPADRRPGEGLEANGPSLAASMDRSVPPSAGPPVASAEEPNESAEVEAPPIVPVDPDQAQPSIDIDAADLADHSVEPRQDIESIAARRRTRTARRKGLRWPLSPLQSGVLALVIVDAFLIGWRNDFVRALPQTAPLYALIGLPVNLRGLGFEDIVTTMEQHEGVPIVVVEGNIVNNAAKIVDVPRLKFVVRNAARQEVYSWTAVASRTVLPPHEAVAFRTRLASPPSDGHDVLVRFVNRHDIVAGTR